jgi:S1-C subfamily serine protease
MEKIMPRQSTIWTLLFSIILITPSYSLNLNTLQPEERNTIAVFQKASPKVVYVHRLATVSRKKVDKGTGSGIIWDTKGHVVTNFHVVRGAEQLSITVGSDTVPAKVIGVEPRMDLAVLEMQAAKPLNTLRSFKPFHVVKLKDMMVGQQAIAIGNPFGLDHSLSKGVISALDRKVPGIGGVKIFNVIQTDAPINPGNSGGPLLNSSGELMGLNTMIFSPSGTSAGIGFAVPAENIERVVNQIIHHGRVVLSGIGIQQMDPRTADRLGVKKGILIAKVLPNSPAAHLQLRPTYRDKRGRLVQGDLIVALNAKPVESYDTFYKLLSDIAVGKEVTLSIQRGSKRLDLKTKTIDVAALA